MKYLLLLLLSSLLLLPLSPARAQTTVLRMDVSGTFSSIEGAGHPDIDIDDMFSFSLTFDDSEVLLLGLIQVSSLLDAEFSVEGQSRPFVPLSRMLFVADQQGNMPAGLVMGTDNGPGLNELIIQITAPAGSVPTVVGSTAEFSDLLLFNEVSFPDATLQVRGQAFDDRVTGSLTSIRVTAVPEPSAALLALAAAAGMLLARNPAARRAASIASRPL